MSCRVAVLAAEHLTGEPKQSLPGISTQRLTNQIHVRGEDLGNESFDVDVMSKDRSRIPVETDEGISFFDGTGCGNRGGFIADRGIPLGECTGLEHLFVSQVPFASESHVGMHLA